MRCALVGRVVSIFKKIFYLLFLVFVYNRRCMKYSELQVSDTKTIGNTKASWYTYMGTDYLVKWAKTDAQKKNLEAELRAYEIYKLFSDYFLVAKVEKVEDIPTHIIYKYGIAIQKIDNYQSLWEMKKSSIILDWNFLIMLCVCFVVGESDFNTKDIGKGNGKWVKLDHEQSKFSLGAASSKAERAHPSDYMYLCIYIRWALDKLSCRRKKFKWTQKPEWSALQEVLLKVHCKIYSSFHVDETAPSLFSLEQPSMLDALNHLAAKRDAAGGKAMQIIPSVDTYMYTPHTFQFNIVYCFLQHVWTVSKSVKLDKLGIKFIANACKQGKQTIPDLWPLHFLLHANNNPTYGAYLYRNIVYILFHDNYKPLWFAMKYSVMQQVLCQLLADESKSASLEKMYITHIPKAEWNYNNGMTEDTVSELLTNCG